jgi:hypothetical protein
VSNGVKLLEATVDLNNWAQETGQRLPFDAEAIAMAEQAGVYFDLVAGKPVGVVGDEVQVLDEQPWLADLEQACGGNVVVQWAMTPEAYFAAVERGEL